MPSLGEVIALLERWYPPSTADSWDAVGLVRDGESLVAAVATMQAWRADAVEPLDRTDHEDANLLLLALAAAEAALARRESVGAHFRSDAVPLTAQAQTATEAMMSA